MGKEKEKEMRRGLEKNLKKKVILVKKICKIEAVLLFICEILLVFFLFR